jgi:hypothetical protein
MPPPSPELFENPSMEVCKRESEIGVPNSQLQDLLKDNLS